MLQIQIATRPILLDYSMQNARLDLQTTRPVLNMETIPAKVEISQPRGQLTIDQTPCRYSIGLKNMTDFGRDNAAFSRQAAAEGVARIVREGYQMARIEVKNNNAIADIAAANMLSEAPDITLAHIASPEIRYEARPVQFNPVAGKVNYSFQPGTVQGDYQPGSVDIRVIQYPEVEISAVDVRI